MSEHKDGTARKRRRRRSNTVVSVVIICPIISVLLAAHFVADLHVAIGG